MNRRSHPLRIAVADDERDTWQFFQALLTHLGHEVVAVAETGRQWAEQCHTTRPDLVITDIKMPDMDGMEAAAVVNHERQVPVILVTGRHDVDLLANAGGEGVSWPI
jgi:response regulator NasT